MVFAIINMSALYLERELIAKIFTTQIEIIEIVIDTIPVIIILALGDFLLGGMEGIVKALNLQGNAAYITIGS